MTEYREYIEHFMRKADESIETARSIEVPDFAVSRAYYGMFYAAQAVLLTKGLHYKRHSAVIANFNREFVKPGVFPKEISRMLDKAFDLRKQGDYSIIPVELEQALAVLKEAAGFVDAVRVFLKNEGFL